MCQEQVDRPEVMSMKTVASHMIIGKNAAIAVLYP